MTFPKILTRDQINALVGLLVIIIVAFVPELRPALDIVAPVVVAFLFALIGIPAIERSLTGYFVMRARALEAQSRGLG